MKFGCSLGQTNGRKSQRKNGDRSHHFRPLSFGGGEAAAVVGPHGAGKAALPCIGGHPSLGATAHDRITDGLPLRGIVILAKADQARTPEIIHLRVVPGTSQECFDGWQGLFHVRETVIATREQNYFVVISQHRLGVVCVDHFVAFVQQDQALAFR